MTSEMFATRTACSDLITEPLLSTSTSVILALPPLFKLLLEFPHVLLVTSPTIGCADDRVCTSSLLISCYSLTKMLQVNINRNKILITEKSLNDIGTYQVLFSVSTRNNLIYRPLCYHKEGLSTRAGEKEEWKL